MAGIVPRLAVLVAVTLTPIFALFFWSSQADQDRERFLVQRDLLNTTTATATSLGSDLERGIAILEGLKGLPAIQSMRNPECSAALRAFQRSHPHLVSLAVVDRTGRMVCHTQETAIGVDVSDREWARAALDAGRVGVSIITRGRVSGVPLIAAGVPIKDANGRVTGVVSVGVELRFPDSFLRNLERSSRSLTLVGPGGLILAHAPGNTRVGAPASPEDRAFLRGANPHDVAEIPGKDGPVLAAMARVPGVDSLVVMQRVPAAVAFAATTAASRRNLLLLALISVLSLGLAYLMATQWIAVPVRNVVRALERIGAGDLSTRAVLSAAPAEIRSLARSLDEMAASLQRREERLEETYRILEETNQRLAQAQRLKSVGQLTSGIAHDFNNLLTVIQGNLDLAAEAENAREQAEYLEHAGAACLRATDMVRRLLAFSGRQQLNPTRIDIGQILTDMAQILRRTLGDAIEVRVKSEELICQVDQVQFENLLLNLGINARDAMPGGGTLSLSARREMVADHPDVKPGPYCVIEVCDTGMGMAEEVRRFALEPFFTTKARGQGTGFGLSQAWGFAKQSGGHLELESTPGVGTTVRLYIPLDPVPEA
ncbi:MAG: cache domain-containing protein [Gemmatimonadota bacterium]